MPSVSLAQRLLWSIAVLTFVATAAYGLAVRGAWRAAETEQFETSFAEAAEQLEAELKRQLRDLPVRVALLCEQSPVVDSALVDLVAGRGHIEPASLLSIRLRLPPLRQAVGLDELVLFDASGRVISSSPDRTLEGKVSERHAQMLSGPSAAKLEREGTPRVGAVCSKARGNERVGLYAAQDLGPLLERLSSSTRLSLSFDPPPRAPDAWVREVPLPDVGSKLYATRSRLALAQAMRDLDVAVLALGAVTIVLALGTAALMSRGLARPIVALAQQARTVVSGEPRPVQSGGGRELEDLADAFNRAIADLVALRKRLAVTERIAARREIAREVAHEIKNPLAPIRAAIETLRRLRARDDPRFDAYFDEASRTVLEEVARITTIVGEFTRFARLPAPNMSTVDPSEVVRAVVGLHAHSGAELRLLDEGAPSIRADRDQLVQVLTNLVKNALEACADVRDARVDVSLRSLDEQTVEIVVSDDGPGVAPEMRERLFEAYATDKPEGTGLGLLIAQRIVVEHGGEITYEPSASGGAAFRVTLPVGGPTTLPDASA